MSTPHILTRMSRLAAAAAVIVAPALPAQERPACAGRAGCTEVTEFLAHVTDFRTSARGSTRYVTFTVRVENKLARPLTLGYVTGSALVTDDEGNRYGLTGEVRGIGQVGSGTFDPSFTLRPGEGGDARFEFAWHQGNAIAGTVFEADLALRELMPTASNQFRLGKEYALRFRSLAPPAVASAPASSPAAPASAPAQATPVVHLADACAGAAQCYSTGPFMAQVTQVTTSGSRTGGYFNVRLNMRFRNVTGEPVILAYRANSGALVDDQGNRYQQLAVQGIGQVAGARIDPQFVLRPGEARDATFESRVYAVAGRSVIGTTYHYDLVVEQIEPLPANQFRAMRQFSVSYRELKEGAVTPAQAAATGAPAVPTVDEALEKAAKGVLDRLRGRRPPP